jgi:hypothetical protein
MTLLMKQVQYGLSIQLIAREQYLELFPHRKDSFSCFSFNFIPRATLADTLKHRLEVYDKLWAKGGSKF